MKRILPVVIALILLLTACHQTAPKNETGQVVTTDTSSNISADMPTQDSSILDEAIDFSVMHHFSDTTSLDCFTIEMPKGNIYENLFTISVYNNHKELIFQGYGKPVPFMQSAFAEYIQSDTGEDATNKLSNTLGVLFSDNCFGFSGETDAVKNAGTGEIKNMEAWNEATTDSNRIIFRYLDSGKGVTYLSYSKKLRKAVVVVQSERFMD